MTDSYRGRLSDGRSARQHEVEVRLERAIEIREPGQPQSQPVLWAFHRLEAGTPLSRRSKDVLLRSLDHPGQSLFVDAAGFPVALLKRAPQLSIHAERWHYAKPGIILAVILAIIAGGVHLLGLSPAKTLARMIPNSIRHTIGEQAMISLTAGHEECANEKGDKALHVLVNELSAASGSTKPFDVRVVDWGIVNAFAVPGEQIVVSSTLIDKAISADEVAGVVAHEMGHGIELHPEAGIVRALGITAAMELIFTGGSGTLTNIGAMLLQLRYSRKSEREADEQALRILHEAGISPKPFSDFFLRLEKEEGGGSDSVSGGGLGSLFSTHPPTPERAKLAAAAATYPAHAALSDRDWQDLKGICAPVQ